MISLDLLFLVMSHILKEFGQLKEIVVILNDEIEFQYEHDLLGTRTVNIHELSDLTKKWIWKQGYTLKTSMEHSREDFNELQFRVSVEPTNYLERAFIGDKEYLCVFKACEYILNEMKKD